MVGVTVLPMDDTAPRGQHRGSLVGRQPQPARGHREVRFRRSGVEALLESLINLADAIFPACASALKGAEIDGPADLDDRIESRRAPSLRGAPRVAGRDRRAGQVLATTMRKILNAQDTCCLTVHNRRPGEGRLM
jgi:hypothetical protein